MADVRIDYGAIKKFEFGPEVRALMMQAGEIAHRSISSECEKHKKTGAYAAALKPPEVDGRNVVKIVNTDKKAEWLELGTDPHVIVPTVAGALFWPGAAHPVMRVNHPGTPAYHPMRNGLLAAHF